MSRRRRTNLIRVGVFALGVIAFLLGSAAILHYAIGSYSSYGEALWSGLRHLLDPGSLQDDEGTGERVIGIVQVLAGLVLIVGVLIAVLEEAVSGSLARLTEADPRVHASGHVVIVGWNGFVPQLVRELQAAVAIGGGHEVVVAIPGRFGDERISIAEQLEARGPDLHISVVTGDPGPAVFDRASARTAATIFVVPGMGSAIALDTGDVETIAAALALREYLAGHGGAGPTVHPALRLGRNLDAVADRFPPEWELVVADRAIGGISGLAASRPELARMVTEPFGPGKGAGIVYAIEPRELTGRPFADAADALARGVPVGLVPARGDAVLVPAPDRAIETGDRIAVVAPTLEAAVARRARPATSEEVPVAVAPPEHGRVRRILAVGSPFTAHALVEDLGARAPQRFSVTIVNPTADETAPREPPPNVEVRATAAQWSDPERLQEVIDSSRPDVVIVSADRNEGEGADPRALLAALHAAAAAGGKPPVIAQLYSEIDEGFAEGDGMHVLAREALVAKWLTLLAADPVSARATAVLLGESEYRIDAATFDPSGSAAVPFGDAYRSLLRGGVLPIGLVRDGALGEICLAPPPDDPIPPGAELVVVRRAGAARSGAPPQPSS